jgi:Asp-tRNA(Asn)/Glu-tRNA(Gln) amidotransferase A subunit family amidase
LGELNTVELSYDELNDKIFDFIPFTWIHNVAGTPAMSVPLFWNQGDLPVGVQFAAKLGAESILYGLAGQLERARPWKDKQPKLIA